VGELPPDGYLEMDDPEVKRVYKVSTDALDFLQDVQFLIRAARAVLPELCEIGRCDRAMRRHELELALRPFAEE
jgi:hypothetical protein